MTPDPSPSATDRSTDPGALRSRIGDRLRFRFDAGSELTGMLLEVRPAVGAPLLALLSEADFFDETGRCLQHLVYFPLPLGRISSVEAAPL